MQRDDYAPFPEAELIKTAEDWEMVADQIETFEQRRGYAAHPLALEQAAKNRTRAAAFRNAVKCHEALRERCLLAEQRVRLLDPDVLASDAP